MPPVHASEAGYCYAGGLALAPIMIELSPFSFFLVESFPTDVVA